MKRRKPKNSFRSTCPIAGTLDLVGDKWSLLVVRDLYHGKTTYGELANSPEKIPTNILADRLRRLQESELIEKTAYQENPVRYAYQLTAKGKALGDVLSALVRWGQTHILGTMTYKDSEFAPKKQKSASASNRRKGPISFSAINLPEILIKGE
ncbi:MAG TPA: helix-turn-helix domain-containing protein [Pyrinomonadaceae bacterium]